jgi:DnaJ-class molecular chaperone
MKDYYSILGRNPDASADEIKKAYREMAKKYHPDTNSGNKELEEVFKQVVEAYETFSDSKKRMEYDEKWQQHERAMAQSTNARDSFSFDIGQAVGVIVFCLIIAIVGGALFASSRRRG